MRGLYAIIDLDACAERDPVTVAEAVLSGGCAAMQLRAKRADDRTILTLGRALAARCADHHVPFFINDRADLAAIVGCALHVGQDDLGVEAARAIVGARAAIGVSTHSLEQALEAERRGATLIGFGPVFATASKENPDPVVGVAGLAAVCSAVRIPVVAIGGVTLARAPEIRSAGAPLAACIQAICGASDPASAARALHEALTGGA